METEPNIFVTPLQIKSLFSDLDKLDPDATVQDLVKSALDLQKDISRLDLRDS